MKRSKNLKTLQRLTTEEAARSLIRSIESVDPSEKEDEDGGEEDIVPMRRGRGDVDRMAREIHEMAGSRKIRGRQTDSASDRKTVDAPVHKEVESVEPEQLPEPASPTSLAATITAEQMDAIIRHRVEEARAIEKEAQAKLERELAAKEAAIAEVEKQREADRQKFQAQEAFFTRYGFTNAGHPVPNSQPRQQRENVAISLPSQRGHISSEDAWREYCNIHSQCPVETIVSSNQRIEQRDTRHADAWYKEHKATLIPAIDAFARKNGLLNGGKEAVTTRADIAPMLLEVLSADARQTHHPAHIWAQFVTTKVDLGKRMGEIVDVPRFAYAESRRNYTDWDLTGVATLNTGAQALLAGKSQVVVKEYGMGKPGLPGNTNAPIGMSTFLNAISVLDLMNEVNTNLRYNYLEFETSRILDGLFGLTPIRYYNKKGEIATAATALAAADDGTCTYAFLQSLAAQMATDKVIPYSNGKYVLTITPNQLKQLERSMEPLKQVMTRATMAEMTQIFSQSAGTGDLNYNGYKGDVGDFMVYCTNTLYDGPVAAPTGTPLQETIAGGAKNVQIGYAFGAGAVGRGVAMPFNVRRSNNDDFQRSEIVVWNSFEGFGALDINSTLDPVGTLVPQQNRVFQLGFTSVAI